MLNNNNKLEFSWQFLRYYSVIRLVLAIFLLLLPFLSQSQADLYNSELYTVSALIYTVLACFVLFVSFFERRFAIQALVQPFIDIIMLSLLAYSGQQSSEGYVILMALATILGILLVHRSIGVSYGILTCLSIVVIHLVKHQSSIDSHFTEISLQLTGLLGVTLLANILARRITYFEDVSHYQQQSILNMHRLNRQIIDKMNRGVVVVNVDNEIMHINQSAWYGLGLPEDPIGKPLKQISVELDFQLSRTLQKPSHNNEGLPFRATNTGPQLLPRFIPLVDDKMQMITLDNYSEVIKKAQQFKLASLGQLTASIAHEIRNPLSAISQAAQLLNEQPHASEQEKDLMQIVSRQSHRINEIIDNIQKVSKRKPPDRQALVLDRFLSSFIKEYKQGLKFNAEILIEGVEKELMVVFDQGQLKQVLNNLFDNALKFSFMNTNAYRVHLTAGKDPANNTLFLDIIDEGIGVSMEEADKIFEPFYTTNHDGTGLGLYISKELCEANHARLDCIPVAFGGACFRISFESFESNY